jgi:hypothetical protein
LIIIEKPKENNYVCQEKSLYLMILKACIFIEVEDLCSTARTHQPDEPKLCFAFAQPKMKTNIVLRRQEEKSSRVCRHPGKTVL